MIKTNKNVPLVSVILPVYNCEDTLNEAIDSIINQTYINWEIVVCDDCSTDNSFNVLKEYQRILGDKFILLQNEKNSKIAYTLNHCLKYAKGKYIARMDGDDRCKPLRFEKQVAFLEEHSEVDCVGTGCEVFDEFGVRGARVNKEYPDKKDIFRGVPFSHPTVMIRKSTYDKLGGYTVSRETLRAEDVDLWFRFWGLDCKGYNIQEVLLEYRERKADFSKRSLKAAIGTTKVFLKYYKVYGNGTRSLFLCTRPIISAIIPKRIMYNYHNMKMRHKAKKYAIGRK